MNSPREQKVGVVGEKNLITVFTPHPALLGDAQ